jgi:Bacterial TniB protein
MREVIMTKADRFTASLEFDAPNEQELEIQSRRLATYTVQALRMANIVGRIYVRHPAFERVVDAMSRIFQLAPEVDIAQGAILTGPSGVGKSAAFKYFQQTLPASSLFAPGEGAIGIRCPRQPRTGMFVASILNSYRYPIGSGSSERMYQRRGLVFDAIKQKGTRLIFVDEAQGLLGRRRSKLDDTEASEFFRELMDECQIGLILSGTAALKELATVDPALTSRVTTREVLDVFDANKEWLGLIRAFVRQCTVFDLTFLAQPEIAKLLHLATEGNLRDFKRLVAEAVLIAFDQQKSQLDRSLLAQAFKLVNGCESVRSNAFE